jgi:3-deoxy-D-manno-octulosonate 8-phosphate phosphatase (KDO 8-P phosphatase)
MPAYEEIIQKKGVSDSAVAYIGDDLPDIPVMRRAGLAVQFLESTGHERALERLCTAKKTTPTSCSAIPKREEPIRN